MTAPPKIRLSVERLIDVTVARFEEKEIVYNELAIADLSRRLMALVETEGTRNLILNFEVVEGLCSYLLGTLFRLQKRLVQELKGRLVFCGIKKHLREVFMITTLDRFVEVVEDEQTALQRF